MAEAQLRQFLDKVRQLNAFVALSEADPGLRQELCDCAHHDEVVALARRCGFEIGRRWGEPPPPGSTAAPVAGGDHCDSTASSTDRLEQEARHQVGGSQTLPLPESVAHSGRLGVAAMPMASASRSPDGAAPLQPRDDPNASVPGPAASAAVVGGLLSCAEVQGSLLAGACPPSGEERTEVILQTPLWRLERIHSCCHSSPAGFWYEQLEEEWVMLLQGKASLRFADQTTDHQLRPGDSLWIRAGRRHRVTQTDPAPGTIWLALFWRTA